MPGGYKNIKGTDGNTFSSTNQPKNPGRKKNILNLVKESGYSSQDMQTVFGEFAWYTISDLENIKNDDSKNWLLRMTANQLILAYKKGDWSKIKEIMEYILGKPTQPTDNKHELKGDTIQFILNSETDKKNLDNQLND